MGLKEKWVDRQNSTNGIDGNNIDANDINEIARAVIDLEENGTGGDDSPKDAIKFSNGIQLRVNKEEQTIEFYNSNTGESKALFFVDADSGTIYADEAFWAFCDSSGNTFEEHYATKEEVGNIETALDAIIALQNSYSGVSE